jgi:GNAT superfamily N-acetyltransferase
MKDASMRERPHITFMLVASSKHDFGRLFELRLAAMRESLERIGRFDRHRAFERFGSTFRPEHTRLIICAGGQLTGCVAFGPSQGALLLEHFYIFPEWQNKGLGSAVLLHLLDEADIAGLPVRLDVLRQSDAARLYVRHGFVETHRGEWDVYYERAVQIAANSSQ